MSILLSHKLITCDVKKEEKMAREMAEIKPAHKKDVYIMLVLLHKKPMRTIAERETKVNLIMEHCDNVIFFKVFPV